MTDRKNKIIYWSAGVFQLPEEQILKTGSSNCSCYSLTLHYVNQIKSTFTLYQPGYRSDLGRKGKSGQQRATHRLTAGFVLFSGDANHGGRERATENYRSSLDILLQGFEMFSLTAHDKRGVRLKT